MSRRIRLWQHDNLWRIQFYCQLKERDGTLQDAWRSHRRNGCVMFFESEQEAREYMREGRQEVARNQSK